MHLNSCVCAFGVHDSCGNFFLPLTLSGRFLSLAFMSCIERWAVLFGGATPDNVVFGVQTDQQTAIFNPKSFLKRTLPSPPQKPGGVDCVFEPDGIDYSVMFYGDDRVACFCILCKRILKLACFSKNQLKKKRAIRTNVARCNACVLDCKQTKKDRKKDRMQKEKEEEKDRQSPKTKDIIPVNVLVLGDVRVSSRTCSSRPLETGLSQFPSNVYRHPPVCEQGSFPPYLSRVESIQRTADSLSRFPDVCPNPFVDLLPTKKRGYLQQFYLSDLCSCCRKVECNFLMASSHSHGEDITEDSVV